MTTGPRKSAVSVPERPEPDIGSFRRQHLALAKYRIATELGSANVIMDEAESPLVWLARRRGRDGRPMIEPHHLQAGERLRAEFTRAQLMPRTTSNWECPAAFGTQRTAGAANATEAMIAARQCVHRALDAAGPEFAGLLVDVCCFLKRLEDVERERLWPARSAKIVLQFGLERLARHYGYASEAHGRGRAAVRNWVADGDRACD